MGNGLDIQSDSIPDGFMKAPIRPFSKNLFLARLQGGSENNPVIFFREGKRFTASNYSKWYYLYITKFTVFCVVFNTAIHLNLAYNDRFRMNSCGPYYIFNG